MLYCDHLETPIGPLLLVSDGAGLVEIGLPRDGVAQAAPEDARTSKPKLHAAARELDEYFAGKRQQFDVPLHPSGTPCQLEVWGALLAIPYAETVSYADIAQRIGRPRAVRAVGAANGANPLAIIVPCHRVIGSHGDLTGYGGGLPAKRWLLAHERRHAPVPTLVLQA
jgi:methylated-DNA-[protein]-cysteine S-methyltransferase